MSDSKFPFNDILKLENIQTLPFGGIVIDVEGDNGIKSQNNSAIRSSQTNMSMMDHLTLFPYGMRENKSVGCSGLLFSKMWFNGACKPHSGDLKIKDIDPKLSDWLGQNSISSFNQKIGTRSPEQLNSLFACFRMSGGNVRLSPKNLINESKFENMVSRGVVLEEWKESPIPIKYALRSQMTKHKLDFLFLLGGTDLLFRHDKFDDLKNSIKGGFTHLNNFFISDSFKNLKGYDYYLRKGGIWRSFDSVPELVALNDESKSVAKVMRSFMRSMIGIIYIRNFMVYAKNVLGENSFDVLEFNATGYELIKADTILDRYEDIYNYVRNIIMLTDLA